MFFKSLNGQAPNMQAPTGGGGALGGFGPQPMQQMSKPGYYGPTGSFMPPNITPPPLTMDQVQGMQGNQMGQPGMQQGNMPQMPSSMAGEDIFRAMLRGVSDDPNAYERRSLTPQDFY